MSVRACGTGVTLGELYATSVAFFDEAGYGEQKYYACGYGLGATYRPTWMDTTDMQSTMIYEDNPIVCAAGMTFLFNCVLTDPSLGLGVAASDTVLITEGGCESLSKLPRDLLIIPTSEDDASVGGGGGGGGGAARL